MPVTYIDIEWPDQQSDRIYSPSSIIEDYFNPGESISMGQFLTACTEGLEEASERVRQKYGYACTSALAESSRIAKRCQEYDGTHEVKIISIT